MNISISYYRLLFLFGMVCLLGSMFSACSTTKNLPEGEYLYTGVKSIRVQEKDKEILRQADEALTEAKAAISVPPNNALFGSSTLRRPLPVGLWIHNSFSKYEKGLGKWIFRHFAADPVLLSSVNPEVRAKAATYLLHDYGFFRGQVTVDTLSAGERKKQLTYQISLGTPYYIDTVMYRSFSSGIDSLLRKNRGATYLKEGALFSVIDVQNEKKRIQTLLRNRGYYYFDPSHLTIQADTVHGAGKISLCIMPTPGIPLSVRQPWYIGKRSLNLYRFQGEELTDSTQYENLTIRYNRDYALRRTVAQSNFRLLEGRPFTQFAHDLTSSRYSNLNVFQYQNLEYHSAGKDSLGRNRLDVTMNTIYDAPYSGTFEANFNSKSNGQLGPGAALTLTKKNVFHGGEALSLKLEGSYEWQTHRAPQIRDKSLINSWETGLSLSLSLPRLLLPNESRRDRRYSNSTEMRVFFNRFNRANYFRMISFGGEFSYQYQSSRVLKHVITPLNLTFNVIPATTARFDSIQRENPLLSLSLQNQFIPAMKYSITFDNASTRHRNKLWWQINASSAGNLTSLVYRAFGKPFDQEKKFLGVPFAQFAKISGEVRYNLKINKSQNLVFRFLTGVICPYGNTRVAPYSEQFYIGGANSLRAFTIRSVGPGSYTPDADNEYAYMDQTGDFKLEANVEYRFRILGSLFGAAFVDTGNVWALRSDSQRSGSTFRLSRLGKDLALDAGLGLRYDLDFLVLRVDAGYALHAPYETQYSGYFNVRKFSDAIGLHLAIGYPF